MERKQYQQRTENTINLEPTHQDNQMEVQKIKRMVERSQKKVNIQKDMERKQQNQNRNGEPSQLLISENNEIRQSEINSQIQSNQESNKPHQDEHNSNNNQAQMEQNSDNNQQSIISIQGQPNQNQEQMQEHQKQTKPCSLVLKETIQYLWKVLNIQLFEILAALLLTILIVQIQLEYSIEQECDPIIRYEARQNNKEIEKCPIFSWLFVNLRNFIVHYGFHYTASIMIVNLQQLRYRSIVIVLLIMYQIEEILYMSYYNLMHYPFSNYIRTIVIQIVLAFLLNLYSKHKFIIQLYKVLIFSIYALMIYFFLQMFSERQKQLDLYFILTMQYIPQLIRKISQWNLEKRLQMCLFYDDIQYIIIVTNCFDYNIFFTCLFQIEISPFNLTVAFINFLLIQTRNILNVNLVEELYKRCLKQKILLVLNIGCIHQLFTLIFQIYESIKQRIAQCFLISLINLVFERIADNIKTDNQVAIDLQQENILRNGYLEVRIMDDQVEDYQSQLSLFSYFIYLTYQLSCIIVNTLLPKVESNNKYITLIGYFSENLDHREYQTLKIDKTRDQVINEIQTINSLLLCFILILVYIKVRMNKNKIIKMADQGVIFIYKCIIIVLYFVLSDNTVFENKYMAFDFIK